MNTQVPESTAVKIVDPVVPSVDTPAVPAAAQPPEAPPAQAAEAQPIKTSAADPAAPSPEDKAKAEAETRRAERRQQVAELSEAAKRTRDAFLRTKQEREARQAAEQRARAEAEARARVEADAQARAKDLESKLALADSDPLAYLESKGITLEQIADRIVKKGTPDEQNAKIAAEIKAMADRVATAEKKLEDERRAWAEREQRAQQTAMWEAAKRQMVDSFEKNAEGKYKNLSAWIDRQAQRSGAPKSEVVFDEFMTMVDRIKRDPRTSPYAAQYSDDEILEALEARYDGWHQPPAPAAKPQPSAPAAPKSGQETQAGSQPSGTKPNLGATTESNGSAPQRATLTAEQQSQKVSLPPDFDKLPDREQNRILAEMLRKGAFTSA